MVDWIKPAAGTARVPGSIPWLLLAGTAAAGVALRLASASWQAAAPLEVTAGLILYLLSTLSIYLAASLRFQPAGALAAAAYFTFLPLGISITSSTEMLGLTSLCLAVQFLLAWDISRKVHLAAAGILFMAGAGLAAPYLVPASVGMAAGMFFLSRGESENRRQNGWLLLAAFAGLIPCAVRFAEAGFNPADFSRLLEPRHYFAWAGLLDKTFNLWLVYLGLWGMLLLPGLWRILALPFWAGYLLGGLLLPAAVSSDPLVSVGLAPLLALCLAPVAQLFCLKACRLPRLWRAVFYAALVVFFLVAAWFAWTGASSIKIQTDLGVWAA